MFSITTPIGVVYLGRLVGFSPALGLSEHWRQGGSWSGGLRNLGCSQPAREMLAAEPRAQPATRP